jgi:hypothetical protein
MLVLLVAAIVGAFALAHTAPAPFLLEYPGADAFGARRPEAGPDMQTWHRVGF